MIRILLSIELGKRRWTQADLARKTGIRPMTINDYFHELTEHVNLEHFDTFCKVLECELSDLLVVVPDDSPEAQMVHSGRKRNKKK